jgi:hypothetical protein
MESWPGRSDGIDIYLRQRSRIEEQALTHIFQKFIAPNRKPASDPALALGCICAEAGGVAPRRDQSGEQVERRHHFILAFPKLQVPALKQPKPDLVSPERSPMLLQVIRLFVCRCCFAVRSRTFILGLARVRISCAVQRHSQCGVEFHQ